MLQVWLHWATLKIANVLGFLLQAGFTSPVICPCTPPSDNQINATVICCLQLYQQWPMSFSQTLSTVKNTPFQCAAADNTLPSWLSLHCVRWQPNQTIFFFLAIYPNLIISEWNNILYQMNGWAVNISRKRWWMMHHRTPPPAANSFAIFKTQTPVVIGREPQEREVTWCKYKTDVSGAQGVSTWLVGKCLRYLKSRLVCCVPTWEWLLWLCFLGWWSGRTQEAPEQMCRDWTRKRGQEKQVGKVLRWTQRKGGRRSKATEVCQTVNKEHSRFCEKSPIKLYAVMLPR